MEANSDAMLLGFFASIRSGSKNSTRSIKTSRWPVDSWKSKFFNSRRLSMSDPHLGRFGNIERDLATVLIDVHYVANNSDVFTSFYLHMIANLVVVM